MQYSQRYFQKKEMKCSLCATYYVAMDFDATSVRGCLIRQT